MLVALPWGKLLAPGGEYYWPVTNPSYAVYEKSGHAFAWQHLVRRSALKFLDKVFAGTGMTPDQARELLARLIHAGFSGFLVADK